MRLNLKLAIVRAGTTQRAIAAACEIPENRFSEIVCGWTEPRDVERARIEAVIGPRKGLFDVEPRPSATAVETRGAHR